jgi:Acetyltransferases
MIIRPYREEDLDHLVAIWKRAVEATHDFLSADDIAALEEQVHDIYIPAVEVYVSEAPDSTPAGFIGLSENMVEMLFIDPQYHGHGMGRALLDHARGLRGLLRVDVNEQNPKAHAFYLKYGFRNIGRSELDSAGRPFPIIHMAETD